MKSVLIQWLGTLVVIAILLLVFQIMWYLAIPVLLIVVGMHLMRIIQNRWLSKRMHSKKAHSIRANQVIDVEFHEVDPD